MSSATRRFEIIHEDPTVGDYTRILRDRETGAGYLFSWVGAGGGLTPLLGADGAPVIGTAD